MCRLGCITLIRHLIYCYTYYGNPLICKLNILSLKQYLLAQCQACRKKPNSVTYVSCPLGIALCLSNCICLHSDVGFMGAVVPNTSCLILRIHITRGMVNEP